MTASRLLKRGTARVWRHRAAFDNFDANKVARYSERKVASLLANDGIVRNRLKINAAIQNAKSFLAVQNEFGSFDKYVWEFVSGAPIHRKRGSAIVADKIADAYDLFGERMDGVMKVAIKP